MKNIFNYAIAVNLNVRKTCTLLNNFAQRRFLHSVSMAEQSPEVELFTKTVEESNDLPAPSKREQKRLKRNLAKERKKELKKLNKGLTNNKDPGFDNSYFGQTEYYFENATNVLNHNSLEVMQGEWFGEISGLRKVYPYYFTFSSFCKKRWEGKTILEIFTKDFHGTETSEYIEAIESGKVKVHGKPVTKDYRVKSHNFIEHTVHRHENPVIGTPLEIIHNDKDVIVINKPPSIPCHPCGRYRFNTISFILGKEYGYSRLRTKTPEKTRQLEDELLHRNVQKEYVCRVVGEFPEEEVVCDQPLDVISHKISMFKVGPKGKPSKTIFKRLSYNGKSSVVKCQPLTGRTHQIRVHLQYLGHPIINDPLYNSPAFGPNRGKGGEFWKPDTEITDAIQSLHNVGLWYDGENPLYHKRMKEIKDKQCEEQCSMNVDLNTDKDSQCSSCSQSEGISTSENKMKDELEEHSLNEPVSKKLKMENDESLNEDEETISKQSNVCDPHDTDTEDSATTTVCSKADRHIEYKSLDESKWIPDEHCSCCRKNYIEPSGSHLVMYLHALSYKGSDWSYSTELPEWAKEDWKDDTDNH